MIPLIFNDPQIGQAYGSDPRLAYSQQLLQQGASGAPVRSWGEGLARALQAPIGGALQSNLAKGYQAQDQSYSQTMAKALQQIGTNPSAAVQTLGQNPNTSGQAFGLAVEQMKLGQKAKRPMNPAELKAAGLPDGTSAQVDAFGNIEVLHQATPATDVQRNYAAAGGDQKWGSIAAYQKYLAQAGANNTTVNMPPLENSFQHSLGEAEGGEIGSISANANTSRATLDQLSTVEALRSALQGAGTDVSALAPIKVKIGALAQGLGIDLSGVTGNAQDPTGAFQALQAVTNRLALSNIGTGKEGAIPANNFSEADRNFVVAMSPQIADTPEGFQAKATIQKRVGQRNLDKETLWNNGNYSTGPQGQPTESDYRRFKSDWAKYVAAHPLFSEQEKNNFMRLVKTGSAATGPGPIQPAISPTLPSGFQ